MSKPNEPAAPLTLEQQARQTYAQTRVQRLVQAEMSNGGKTFEQARAALAKAEPRLCAIAEGNLELDATLAAEGQDDPLAEVFN